MFDNYDNLIKPKIFKKRKHRNRWKNYKNLVIYSTRYDHHKTITMLSLHYHALMGKIKEHEGKKSLIVDDYVLEY